MAVGKYKDAIYHKNGLYSTIYKAKALPDTPGVGEGARIALKITNPARMEPPHNSEKEARVLKRTVCSNVIPLLETFQQAGGMFILAFPFMPYDLETLLRRREISPAQGRSHLRDVFRGLAHVHSHGIIHRDIKPSNILIGHLDGPAYIADFGIVWAPDDPASEPFDNKITDVGTTSYRPPELLFGKRWYDCSLDLWAAGCVVAEVSEMSGRILFESGDLGSELALIMSIFKTLGTPNEDIWPEAASLPDWKKMQFYDFPAKEWDETLPASSSEGRDLVSKLLRYESGQRLSADEALKHPYLDQDGR